MVNVRLFFCSPLPPGKQGQKLFSGKAQQRNWTKIDKETTQLHMALGKKGNDNTVLR